MVGDVYSLWKVNMVVEVDVVVVYVVWLSGG